VPDGSRKHTHDTMIKDIALRKRIEQQLLKSERLSAIGEVAAMVVHDLRDSLTGIKGAVYYLKMRWGSKLDKESKEVLDLIESDVEYSNKIVNDLLDFSKQIQLQRGIVDIKSLISEVLSKTKAPKMVKIKPIDMDKVLSTVEEHLEEQRKARKITEDSLVEFIETRVHQLEREKEAR